jgi:hypothetical protein
MRAISAHASPGCSLDEAPWSRSPGTTPATRRPGSRCASASSAVRHDYPHTLNAGIGKGEVDGTRSRA